MAKRKPKPAPILYPVCVRHAKSRKDVRLRHFFMCDSCCDLWTRESFDGNASLYNGEEVDGYCLLCNVRQKVRLRTWFLCDICHRVAGAIGRNHVAELAIMGFWDANVKLHLPNIEFERMDISSLRPRRDTDESAQAPIDFIARDKKTKAHLFGIENKTGRSSISDMSKFQLDISDCDTILNDMRRLNIPAYIIHAQVLEIWLPPTVGFEIKGLWWTDVYRMTQHFQSVQMRRDENRGAAYFNKKAFLDISTFADAVRGISGVPLTEQFKIDGIPAMYHTS